MIINTDVEKKYIGENALWILSLLPFTYRVIIYRLINPIEHVRIRTDGIN